MVIIPQYIHISKYQVVHLKYIYFLYDTDISIKLLKILSFAIRKIAEVHTSNVTTGMTLNLCES